MANFGLIFVCIAAGMLLRKSGRFGQDAASTLGTFVIYVALPALVFAQVPVLVAQASLDASTLVPISMAWLTFFVALAAVHVVGRARRWSNAAMGALVLTMGLGNTSFVGFPVVEAFLGADALRYAILADQPGSFGVLSTVGMVAGVYYANKSNESDGSAATPSPRSSAVSTMARRLFGFPPMIALFLALAFSFSGVLRPSNPLEPLFDKLGATLVPVALVSVGAQLRIERALFVKNWRLLAFGLVLKLLVFPALFVGLYVYLLGTKGVSTHVTILEAAMAPMVTGAVLAGELELDADLANAMVGLGIPLSLVTLPVWNVFLTSIL